jgi:choice-of-anchor A domain-containing protein
MHRVGLACLLTSAVILGALNCSPSESGPEPVPAQANLRTAAQEVAAPACTTCLDIHLGDYNLFLLEDFTYTGNIQGKLAAGGNISLSGFSVGTGLPDNNVANTLVAGGNLTLTNGAVAGAAWYGGTYSPKGVSFSRGTAAHGSPVDFAARFAELESLSTRLATQRVNGTTQHTPWSVTMTGTDPCLNVFTLKASDFTGQGDWTLTAPASSFVLVNVFGQAPAYKGGNIQLAGIRSQRVLFNFVEATTFTAESFRFQGTLLAPKARATIRYTAVTGGLYAKALTLQFAPADSSPLEEMAGATAEVCNAVDDNCDGQVDEGFECTGSGSRACTAWCGAEGTQSCNAATCGYEECTSASCCRADADCASGSYCEGSVCTPRLENGGSCTSSNQCSSGQCVDGVCCNSACAGECDACNLPGQPGTCSPVPSSVECRGAAGACDVAEFCTGSSAACPVDAKKPATTECRGSAGACDVAERCTGSSNDCPADGYVSSTTECRASAGTCDVAEFCTGGSAACPGDTVQPATTACRASAGECDVAEFCTGSGASCPADGFQSAGSACTGDGNVCTGDVCDGAGSCSHPRVPPETSCGTSYGPWGSCGGFGDYCDTTGTQSRTVTASTCGAGTCGPSSSITETQECTRAAPDTTCAQPRYGEWSTCSYSDTCAETGTRTRTVRSSAYSCATGLCVESTGTETEACTRSTAGVQCRAGGVCDFAEYCAGGSCPADKRMPAGTTCNDGNAGTTGDTCDGAGVCTGCGDGVKNGSEACDDGNTVTETSCPYGQTSCTRCNATCSAVLNLTGAYCGDGTKNGPEACDDGNTVTETSCPYGQTSCTRCNATCTAVVAPQTSYCGDGVRNGPEVCDDGNTVTETSCPGGAWTCNVCNYNCSAYVHINNTPAPPSNCPSMTVSWNQWQPAWNNNPRTKGTYFCSGTLGAAAHGSRATASQVRGTIPELFRTGSVQYTCNDGSWKQVAGSATCDGLPYSTYHVTCASSSDPARKLFLGFYMNDLKRCADILGLDWWMSRYNTECLAPNFNGFSSKDACFQAEFLKGSEDDEVKDNGGHISDSAERNQCGTRAAASWTSASQDCKPVPGQM